MYTGRERIEAEKREESYRGGASVQSLVLLSAFLPFEDSYQQKTTRRVLVAVLLSISESRGRRDWVSMPRRLCYYLSENRETEIEKEGDTTESGLTVFRMHALR